MLYGRGDIVFGVSDGSASKGLAAHGWKHNRRPNDPLVIRAHGPVDGLSPTAFWAKMHGQVAVLTVPSLLIADRGICGGHIISLCDNRAMLRRLAAHSRSMWVRDQLDGELDLFLLYRDWMKKLYVRCTRQWVKGHQDRKKPFHEISIEGLLNIEVDELTTSAYDAAGIDKTSHEVDVYADEVYGIFIDGVQVTNKVKVNYLLIKHGLLERKMDSIDWLALSGFLWSLSPQRRAMHVRISHNWIPTNSFLYQQRGVGCDKCPLCNSAIETHEHVRAVVSGIGGTAISARSLICIGMRIDGYKHCASDYPMLEGADCCVVQRNHRCV